MSRLSESPNIDWLGKSYGVKCETFERQMVKLAVAGTNFLPNILEDISNAIFPNRPSEMVHCSNHPTDLGADCRDSDRRKKGLRQSAGEIMNLALMTDEGKEKFYRDTHDSMLRCALHLHARGQRDAKNDLAQLAALGYQPTQMHNAKECPACDFYRGRLSK